jgi:hypothetical protein
MNDNTPKTPTNPVLINGEPLSPNLDPVRVERVEALITAKKIAELELSQLAGMIKATDTASKFFTVFRVKLLAEIKESKRYKGLTFLGNDRQLIEVKTWSDLCHAIGYSVDMVDEQITNLQTFGEEFLSTADRMGLSYRNLRQLRRLPDDDRAAIVADVEVSLNDKEAILDLIDDLTARHRREKTKWDEERADLEKKAQFTEQRIDAVVQAETKDLATERDALVQKVDELETQLGGGDWRRALEQARRASETLTHVLAELRKFYQMLPEGEPPAELRTQIEACVFHLQKAGDNAWKDWINRTLEWDPLS